VTKALNERIEAAIALPVEPPVANFARRLAEEAGALAVLFYGSNLRTGSLEGVLDFYVLLPGPPESGIWPVVSYREWDDDGHALRAKIATMTLARFGQAARGELLDTTIWARFVQPRALVWNAGEDAKNGVIAALAGASATAARLAAVLGPARGSEAEFWLALFRETYKAEFRVEDGSRAQSILDFNPGHFDGLLPLALEAAEVGFAQDDETIAPRLDQPARNKVLGWWRKRRRFGKPLNFARLLKASTTFDGAARYAAWKIERHTGVKIDVTPWREKHPVLAAPGVLYSVWRRRKRG
jgi:hypothetical protein